MENLNNQNEKDNMMESILNKIQKEVNPYNLGNIEKYVKDSLNPQLSQSEVRSILNN